MSDAKWIQLVLATGNKGKVNDFQSIFDASGIPVSVLPITKWCAMPEVEETEQTFSGNARLKAEAARSVLPKTEALWVLADDSGMAVEALNGAPGVHSARYAGEQAMDEDNRDKLLKALQGYEPNQRGAAFVCSLCLLDPEGSAFACEGRCEGSITHEPLGENGFGYDPLFVQNGQQLTWGQLPTTLKNRDNHRARATQILIDYLGPLTKA